MIPQIMRSRSYRTTVDSGMKLTQMRKLRVVACVVLVLAAAHGSMRGAEYHVYGSSIQSFLGTSRAGDTIIVNSGYYRENLIIDKRLTIIGRGKAVIDGNGKGSVVIITADSCRIRGLSIVASGKDLMAEDAGILVKSDGNTIEDNLLDDVLFGIYLLKADGNVMFRNRVGGKRLLDIGERGSGMHIWNGQHNRFIDNAVTNVRDGFYIQNANHTWVENNRVSYVRYGLHYMYADSNTFIGNSFTDNVAGAAVMYSRGIVMRHNLFARNRGFASYGILFQDCHGLQADSNVVVDNVVGMFFEASSGNRFAHNVVARNDVALQMFQNSTGNVFTQNSFIDNLSPLAIVGKRTESAWSENGKGNYWSSYEGYDLDGNGTGDVPMKIQNVFHYLEGRNAHVRLYLYSPASQALGIAAAAFPIIRLNEETDPHPLMWPPDFANRPIAGRGVVDGTINKQGEDRNSQTWALIPVSWCLLIGFAYYRLGRRT